MRIALNPPLAEASLRRTVMDMSTRFDRWIPNTDEDHEIAGTRRNELTTLSLQPSHRVLEALLLMPR